MRQHHTCFIRKKRVVMHVSIWATTTQIHSFCECRIFLNVTTVMQVIPLFALFHFINTTTVPMSATAVERNIYIVPLNPANCILEKIWQVDE